MAWSTPGQKAPGELTTADEWNELVDDLVYLKRYTDCIYVQGGFTTGTQTILPIGSVTESVWIHYAAWNDTGNTAIGTPSNALRLPGSGDTTLSDAGPTNTVLIHYPANGSITAERTLGSVTWGLRLLLLYL